MFAVSTSTTPPIVTLLAPSMKPEPRTVKVSSSPGRPDSMPVTVGTICSRMPRLARSVCAPEPA